MLAIFDGRNDSVQRLQECRPDGIDFLARSTGGHLDLPRAIDGGLVGGLFAISAAATMSCRGASLGAVFAISDTN
jgi:membrane dipeptidase